eukprot:1406980-Prymnesium_polylepis.2
MTAHTIDTRVTSRGLRRLRGAARASRAPVRFHHVGDAATGRRAAAMPRDAHLPNRLRRPDAGNKRQPTLHTCHCRGTAHATIR